MLFDNLIDALGRRISKTTDGTSTYFYYDTDNRVIAQYIQEQSQNVQPDRTFVYGNGITEVLAMFLHEKPYNQDDVDLLFGFFDCWLTSTGNPDYNDDYDYVNDNKIDLKDWAVLANHSWNLPDPASYETLYYYLTDALGSVRGLIGGRLNQESDREFYNYDVYGATTDTSAMGNPLMFAGYYHDNETSTYYTYFRTYNPITGRMHQLDPWGYIDSMNLYEYVVSNPVNFVDPYGSASQPVVPVPNPPNYPQPYPGSGGRKIYIYSEHSPEGSYGASKRYARERGMDFHKIGTKRDKNDTVISSPEDQLANITGKYKKDCVSELTLFGHGKAAGISTEPSGLSGINGYIAPDVAKRIAVKLCPDAVVNICSCHPADYQQNHQMLADKLQARVCACDGPLYAPCNCAGSWKCKTPKTFDRGIAAGRMAKQEDVQGITGAY